MSTSYSKELNQLAQLIWQQEAEQEPKTQAEPSVAPPADHAPSDVFWGKWRGRYIVVTRYISGRTKSNVKLPNNYSDEAMARSAALDIIRKFPEASIRYLPAKELAVYL
ncbi:hypothetical protein MO867_03980 [Microbulbifer sp. OS29]|uniref:Uncharacterized protein n=1 Tax=Microbulbifer okhotskensis TaxID=2926617 RepID=A0A9X2J3W7_9GAMM|nr:hypothetical protein [Microbulbifer okhotskensis]MCO1333493.1 hypothetical protein [Microbulbifer okhotskensis]